MKKEEKLLKVGVLGCGPISQAAHFEACRKSRNAELYAICDVADDLMEKMANVHDVQHTYNDYDKMLADPQVEAVIIGIADQFHVPAALKAIEAGKHVLIEKPFTTNSIEAEELIELAERQRLTLMVDHTFVYTGAIRKIKEMMRDGELGDLLYFDSVRINLGIFQSDINVVWDLAPHDLSIMDFLVERKPVVLTATGSCHVEANIENIAYLMLKFDDSFIAHFHFNWLSPVKIRRTLIAGSRKMIVYDDIEPTEKVRVYDKGIVASRSGNGTEEKYQTLVSYRTGDVWVPKLDTTEALRHVSVEFLETIRESRAPLTDGHAGLRVVRMLEAAQASIEGGGKTVEL